MPSLPTCPRPSVPASSATTPVGSTASGRHERAPGGAGAGRGPAALDREGRARAAGGRDHQPQLRGARRRAALSGADRRRHPRAQHRPPLRARRGAGGACGGPRAGGAALGGGGAGPRLHRRADLRRGGRARPGEPRPAGGAAAALPPRGAAALPRPGADLLGFPGVARLCARVARGRQPLSRRPAVPRGGGRAARGGGRAGRDRLRPQRPAAGEPDRRRRPALARRLGICRVQLATLRPRRSRVQRRHVGGRARRRCSPPTTGASRTRRCCGGRRR